MYRPGVTYVGSTVADLLQAGAGVCQDLVHLSLVLLRRHGIAARYVSGFLWAAPQEEGSDSLEVETHAWLEALLPGTGGRGEPVWVGADPTNRQLAGEGHVKTMSRRTRERAHAPDPARQRLRIARATLPFSTRPGRVVFLPRTRLFERSFFRSHLMARGDVRIAITLACEECKRRNYQTNKSKRNTPDRITLQKYCKWCRRSTSHKETR